MIAWRWLVVSLLVVSAAAVACETTGYEDPGTQAPLGGQKPPAAPAPTRAEKEISRRTIGPAGGTVEGAGASITVPEGALSSDVTIILKEIDPLDVLLPFRGALAGKVYAFEPDDVTFAKPVTIAISINPALPKEGAVVLMRSPKAANVWETRGGGSPTSATIVAETDHFSDWVPFAIPDEPCLFGMTTCASDAGYACHMPADPAAVRCTGSTNDPIRCTCTSNTQVIATFDSAPSDSALSALAIACGASCESLDAGVRLDAEDGGQCAPSATCGSLDAGAGWVCQTTPETSSPALRCQHVDGASNAECQCGEDPDSGVAFTLVEGDTPPLLTKIVQIWRDRCQGSCIGPNAGDAATSDAD